MHTLRINRSLDTNIDPKQALRAHVEKLPVDKQREFVAAAFQLLGDRIDLSKVGKKTKTRAMN